jgi:hypothetical protein
LVEHPLFPQQPILNNGIAMKITPKMVIKGVLD